MSKPARLKTESDEPPREQPSAGMTDESPLMDFASEKSEVKALEERFRTSARGPVVVKPPPPVPPRKSQGRKADAGCRRPFERAYPGHRARAVCSARR